MSDPKKRRMVDVNISDAMIIAVVQDYEREHPGADGWQMPSREFSGRLMKKIMASAEVVEGSEH